MVRRRIPKKKQEAGQAVLLVVAAMSIFLLGAVGLAIDGSQLYAQRQMAQAAADAAATAGIISFLNGSNTGTNNFGASAYTCTSSNTTTPCAYARKNGFGVTSGSSADTVYVEPNPAGVTVSNLDSSPPNLLRVTVTRPVNMTLTKFVGLSSYSVRASATAAIVDLISPVPIIVTHPTLSGALSLSGGQSNGGPSKVGSSITIVGGPRRSIQVNSSSASSIVCGNATVDLSGGDFGDFGGASSPCFTFQGGGGRYVQPASPIADPLASVPVPPIPNLPAPVSIANSTDGCPPSPTYPCKLYSPGLYSSGIDATGKTIVFKPGIYYVTSGGFGSSGSGDMVMATGFTDDSSGTNTGWTGNMLVYNTGNGNGDVFRVGSYGTASLIGSPTASVYKGILFFEDPNSAAHFSPPVTNAHNFGGGGALTLIGTIYINSNTNSATNYQEVDLQSSSSGTNIQGEIIASVLQVSGSRGITISLSANKSYTVRQVALVQ